MTPLLQQIDAPPAWRRIAFISDLHLGADAPGTLRALHAWLRTTPADALFILGDLFEAWVGDDAAALPYAQDLAAALREFGRPVHFQHGNRDFLLRAFEGLQLLDERCVLRAFGDCVLLAHGDALCLDDHAYQQVRALVRSPAWQQDFLALPFAERLQRAAQMRDASRRAQGAQANPVYAEPDAEACRAALLAAGCRRLVHGHTHRPGRFELGEGCERLVLSDWDFEGTTPRGDCLLWTAQGWQREPVWA